MTKLPPHFDIPDLIDNPHAPDIYADDAIGFFLFGNNVRITFYTTQTDHSVTPNAFSRVVIGRLVMPLVGAENMARGLTDFINTMKGQAAPPIGNITLQ